MFTYSDPPDPRELQLRMAAIRARWSDDVERKRQQYPPVPWSPPECDMSELRHIVREDSLE